jgi:putative hydrolase of the HAD superfamily
MSRPVTTVVFDYGGVLSLPLDPESLRTLAAWCGLPADRMEVEIRRERLAYDAADIALETYWSRILGLAGRAADAGLLERLNREDLRAWSRINDRVLGWSRALRAEGFRTAILSNMPQPLLDLMNEDPSFAWLREFEVRVFSCEVRMVKPGPGIFRVLLDRLREPAGSCVFLDDVEHNVAGALDVGLRALHFRSADEASAALRSFGLPAL